MISRIIRIWLVWLIAMLLLVAVTWALLLIELPGGSSGTPTREDILAFFAHMGIFGTVKFLGVLLAPPILLTSFEVWKARRATGYGESG